MNLLKAGVENNTVLKTDNKKKIVIDNISKDYAIYKIKVDQLYYNDQNDRIATWISQYKVENNINEFKISNKEDYNSIIHKFITESNPSALKNTQRNINMIGQQEPGVVLSDGRIIDGNRRFTCLRNIQSESGKSQYFEAVILDHNLENNAKQIKLLELMLQHGVDEKVSYNPVERLVGIYHDIVETKLLTIKEYADSVNQTVNEIQIEVEKSELMVEFLEFINAPKQFHIARDLNLGDQLKELNAMLKKIKDEDKKEDLKNLVFSQFLIQPFGDTTRYLRKIKKIASNSKFVDEYLEEQADIVEKVCDEIIKYQDISKVEINAIRSNDNIKNEFLHSTEKYVNKVDGDDTRNLPVKQAEKAYDSLDLIDINILRKLNDEQKNDFNEKLDSLMEIITSFRSELDVQ